MRSAGQLVDVAQPGAAGWGQWPTGDVAEETEAVPTTSLQNKTTARGREVDVTDESSVASFFGGIGAFDPYTTGQEIRVDGGYSLV